MRVAVQERYRSGRELLDASKTARRSSPGHGGCEVGDGAVESAGRWLLPTSTTPRLSATQPHLPNPHCTRRTYSSLPLSVSPPLCFFFPSVHPHPSSFILSATSPSVLGSLPGSPFPTVGNDGNDRLCSGGTACLLCTMSQATRLLPLSTLLPQTSLLHYVLRVFGGH